MSQLIYFVTGASGFVGRQVCRQLLKSGHTVRALVRRDDVTLREMGVHISVGDLWERELLLSVLGGVQVVVHCAGKAVFGNGPDYKRENADLTSHLLACIKVVKIDLRRFVYISTIGAVDRNRFDRCAGPLVESSPTCPVSDYGKSKLEGESIVQSSGLPYTIIRPTMVVGAEMRYASHFAVFARYALGKSLMARFAWPGQFSVLHVGDLAEAIEFASSHHGALGKTLFCAGESVSMAQFFRWCAPARRLLPLAWLQPLFRTSVAMLPFKLKAMMLPALVASDENLRALGWSPRYTAQEALSEVVNREWNRVNFSVPQAGQTVITGAASGLGRALVMKLVGVRANMLLVDRDVNGLHALAVQYPTCRTIAADLSNIEDLHAVISSPHWREYEITELYACAGIGQRGAIQDISTEMHVKMFQVNVLARIALAREAIRGMIARQFGRVVLISSSSAFQPLPYMATYAATNSALLSLGEAWAEEVASQGVLVMTACPGGMQTNFQRTAGVKQVEREVLMSAAEVADRILAGLRNQRTTLIVSIRAFAMAQLARILPRNVSVRLWGRLMEKMR